MPSQVLTSVENNFTKGLITEFTGLNFPENAATDCDNVDFTLTGDVTRRFGVNFETNATQVSIDRSGVAMNTYKWDNAGGDGDTQLVVTQVGETLYFWNVTAATTASPLSAQKLASTVTMSDYVAPNGTYDDTKECQFTDGSGYLFVFHPDCDPIYCEYIAGTVTSASITVKIRDFSGVIDGLATDARLATLSDLHKYNLQNQGWVNPATWTASGTYSTGHFYNLLIYGYESVFTVQSGITGVSNGQAVSWVATVGGSTIGNGSGWVVSYTGTTLDIMIASTSMVYVPSGATFTFTQINPGYIGDFFTDTSSYPSNADQWWRFKNSSGVFDPATTADDVMLGLGEAPKGHYVLDAFSQNRIGVSGLNDSGIAEVTTLKRPTHGCWFQGRIWYAGTGASQAATSTTYANSWTEDIYFSQIVNTSKNFGKCYQENDPTSETLFDLLPTDGGVISIQGSGAIYKLFPLQNGLLVFASNGVWFITGSQGIGFAANDYTITKISNIQSISTTSFVNVMGLPYFWNEEGIYQVKPSQQGSLTVESITVGTILSFYNDIPLESKKNVKGAYHPIDYVIQWVYRSTNSANTTEKYTFDSVLNFNVFNKAFYPYTIDTTQASINGIVYVSGPGGSTTVEPAFKYFSSVLANATVSFAEAYDTDYLDWGVTDYNSYFITGYKLHGQAQRRFQIPYLYVYSRTNGEQMAYKIQSIWDYARSGNGGRWSSSQQVSYVDNVYQNNGVKRHRLRGHGLALQIKISSVEGQPFDIIGWSAYEVQNIGV